MQENHSVTLNSTQPPLPVSRIDQAKFYLKAGAILLATTTIYVVAQAIRSLPKWQNDTTQPTLSDAIDTNVETTAVLVDSSQIKTTGMEEKATDRVRIMDQIVQSGSHGGLTDFQEIPLELLRQKDVREKETDPIVETHVPKRKLLQTATAPVVVANPIPDQIIQIGDQYTYDLSQVFSGEYSIIKVAQAEGNNLPSWLTLEYQNIASYPTADTCEINNVAVAPNTVFMTGCGLQIINVTNPSKPNLLSIYYLPGQHSASSLVTILVLGNTLFAADASYNGGLRIIDVSNLTNPNLLSSYLVGTYGALDLAVSENTVFLACYSIGLNILNVSDFTNPTLLSTYPVSGSNYYISGIAIFESTAFVSITGASNGPASLKIVDVSDLTAPLLIGTFGPFYDPSSYGIPKIAVSGNTVFMPIGNGNTNNGLNIIDVSDPANPYLIRYYPLSGGGTFREVMVSGDILLGVSPMGLQVLDISTPGNTTLLSSYFKGGSILYKIALFDNKVFIAYGSAGLQILDMTQSKITGIPLTSDVIVGQQFSIEVSARNSSHSLATDIFTLTLNNLPGLVVNTLTDQSIFPGQSFKLSINSKQLFATASSSFLRLSLNPVGQNSPLNWLNLNQNPTLLGTYPAGNGGAFSAIAVSGNTAFVVNQNIGLQILDVKDLAYPQLLCTYQIRYGGSVAVSGNTIFITDYTIPDSPSLHVLNVTSLANPELLGNYSIENYGSGINGIAISGNRIFVNNNGNNGNTAGFQVLDISDRTNLRLLGNYSSSGIGFAYGIAVSKDIVFLPCALGLQIIDASVPSNSQLLTVYPADLPNGYVCSVAVSGNIVFVGNGGGENLKILNVANPSSPQLLASYKVGGSTGTAVYITVSGNTVFVTNNFGDLEILDVRNVTNPKSIGSRHSVINSATSMLGVHVSGKAGFLTNGDLGLEIVDLSIWQLTANPTTADEGNYHLKLTATDIIGSSISTSFTVRVEGTPRIYSPILPQYAQVGQSFYLASGNTFTDPNFDPLIFTVAPINSTALPAWLNFDPVTVTFSGTPTISDIGTTTMQLTATDPLGGAASTQFNMTVTRLPAVINTLTPLTLIQSVPFTYSIPTNVFNGYGHTLSYDLLNGDGGPLPAEFQFFSTNLTLTGTPEQFGITNLLWVAAYGSNNFLSTPLNILIHANLPILPSQYAKVARAFSYYAVVSDGISSAGFNPLTFRAGGFNATSAIETTLPNWLNFNAGILTFSGIPSSADVGTIDLCLTAQDSLGNSARTVFNITVIDPPALGESLQPLTLTQNVPFSYTLPVNTTFTSHGQSLRYSLTSAEGNLLPAGFQFNASNITLWGSPQNPGILNLLLIAQDEVGDTLSAPLSILTHAGLPILPPQYAKVSQPFSYYAAVSDGLGSLRFSPLTFSARGVEQTTLPGWLSFNPGTLAFGGTPSASDLGTAQVRLISTDSLGGMAYTDFNISVIYAPKVNQPITQALNLLEGRYFTFSIPAETFYSYEETLTYSIKNGDGSGLVPLWIQFNPNNATLFGTPQNAGAVTLFIIAQDVAHNQASTPLSLIISANAPPQVMQPISTQTAQAGQLFNFFVPANTFVDPNGDALTYSASLLGSSAFPGWLSFDPKTVSFKGTPSGSDTDAFSARIHTIVLVAADPERASASTLFNLNVGGTSNTALALRIGAPTLSVLGALFGLYRNRAHLINRARYPKYQKPNQEIRVGEPFILQLSTPRHLVGSVKAKIAHVRPQGCVRFIDTQRFFKKPLHYLQLPFDKLPGGESLPHWMEYDEDSNILYSKGPVPDTHYRELNIRVKNKNGYVTEQFNLKIEGATLSNLPADEEAGAFSMLPTQARLEREQNQSAVELQTLDFKALARRG